VALLILSEYNTSTSFDTPVVLFKRGSKSSGVEKAITAADEEKSVSPTETAVKQDDQDTEKPLIEQSPTVDIFSWQHITYTVPTPDGDRVLLNDVSGYVTPGKLTALMGESGAGKASHGP
jgi:ATP-binding cassette subfamily G (WHITE) protein 2 (SNQ2)